MAENHDNVLVSVSDLCSYLWCKRQLYLQKIYGIKIPFKPELAVGTIQHAARENASKLDEQVICSVKKAEREHIEQLFVSGYSSALRETLLAFRREIALLGLDLSSAFRQLWPVLAVEARVKARSVFEIAQREKVTGSELWQAYFPKIETEKYLESAELGIKGRLDRVEIYKDELFPVELKTGSIPKDGVWPSHRLQIACYMLLLAGERGFAVKRGIVEYVDSGERREILYNPFMREEVKQIRGAVVELLSARHIPASCGRKSCIFCAKAELPSDERVLKEYFDSLFAEKFGMAMVGR